jgi:ribonuclease HI
MELVAVLEALKALKMNGLSVAVYTNSQLVVGLLRGSYSTKKPHLQSLMQDIKAVVDGKSLDVGWFHVQGHNGDSNNVRADQLARNKARENARCICTDFLNFNPDPVANPDCPLHGAGFAHWEV